MNANPQGRFFVNYQRGKCTTQNIGRNKISGMPQRIAEFLVLPEAQRYKYTLLNCKSDVVERDE